VRVLIEEDYSALLLPILRYALEDGKILDEPSDQTLLYGANCLVVAFMGLPQIRHLEKGM
jgi:hypothetical protein